MARDTSHEAVVDAWLSRRAAGRTGDELVEALGEAFDALWRRGLLTLGDVTLGAIADRVIVVAAGRFPVLSPLSVEADGLRWDGLKQRASGLPREAVAEGVRFVLVELLTVVGDLTAEILTPALHAELEATAALGHARSEGRPERVRARDRHARGEPS